MDQGDTRSIIKSPRFDGTVKRGSATCPCCGYTTQVARLREQIKSQRGGANHARLLCVVTTKGREQGRAFRLPDERDARAVQRARHELERRKTAHRGKPNLVPDEQVDIRGVRHTWGMIYGLTSWGDYFTDRQLLALTSLTRLVEEVATKTGKSDEVGLRVATQTVLALGVSRIADIANSLCTWKPSMTQAIHLFARQAIPMTWDFAETSLLSNAAGDFGTTIGNMLRILEGESAVGGSAKAEQNSACEHRLPDDSADLFITDPPYYDAVPYAYLADFFYVWLRRSLGRVHGELFREPAVPKDAEIVVDRPHELSNSTHNIAFYERELTRAFAEGRRVAKPEALGTVVFASKTTASWEAILKAVVDAGWIVSASWPIDTEMETRVSAQGQARLASSVHLVCRPREDQYGSIRADDVGDWRDVLAELPRRIHAWMPRLAEEGVVGADAIFACLGPALEIFSRYARVEKASGEAVTLKEFLEYVWAAVAKEALTMIFTGADATGFEEDARLTAMWLWTLKTSERNEKEGDYHEDDSDEDEEGSGKKGGRAGFVLEFDAARKIAQGLGAHLEDLTSVVAVEGETARLLSVVERARALFGKDEGKVPPARREREPQLELFKGLYGEDDERVSFSDTRIGSMGNTVLDRVHQSMVLFGAGRSEALKRLLVENGTGNDQRFWRLAQALSALYPTGMNEKRWVDGVLARKKALGF